VQQVRLGYFEICMIHILGGVQVPQLVKQVIQFRELTDKVHSRLVWELDEPVMHQYAVGNALDNLVPPSAVVDTDLSENYNEPLFNKKNHLKIMENVGQYGLLHIQLMPKKFLTLIFVEPDSIAVDLITATDGSLIYEFYNPSSTESVTITATCAEDTEGIYSKIQANPDDLEYRQYFIKLAMDHTESFSKMKDRDIMTAKQAADYLGIAPGTIANWTSDGKIPVVYAGASPRYRREELDNWLNKNPRPKKK
jgi:excisionase family DNA binding protein